MNCLCGRVDRPHEPNLGGDSSSPRVFWRARQCDQEAINDGEKLFRIANNAL